MASSRSRARTKGRRWPGLKIRLRFPKARWKRAVLAILAGVAAFAFGVLGFYYVQFSRIIEARLHGERDRVIPRVFARPLTLHTGQGLSERELVARLNDVGYTERARVERAGEFAVDGRSVVLVPRGGDHAGQPVRIAFAEPKVVKVSQTPPAPAPDRISRVEAGGKAWTRSRSTRRCSLVSSPARARSGGASRLRLIPSRMKEAVLAIEDRRFYAHPGIDPISVVGALFTNLTADRRYPVGRSTITQQLSRMFFLSDEFNAELQSGTALLPPQGARSVHGADSRDEGDEGRDSRAVPERRLSRQPRLVRAARRRRGDADLLRQGRQQPDAVGGGADRGHHPESVSALAVRQQGSREGAARRRARRWRRPTTSRRDAANARLNEPITVVARAVDNEAPYFVDYLSDELADRVARRPAAAGLARRLHDARPQSAALRTGGGRAAASRRSTRLWPKRKVKPAPAQAALIAVDPRTGEVLALVGGRFYNQSQFNRAIAARRQPGSTFKPFVYLAAFERAARAGRRPTLTPATMVSDEPTTWTYDEQEWSPRNYDSEYDGYITLRRALALSRNIATIKVAEQIGFDHVAALWKTHQGRARPRCRAIHRSRWASSS